MAITIVTGHNAEQRTVLRCDVCGERVEIAQDAHDYGTRVREFLSAHQYCMLPRAAGGG